jgi:hypothetical protein
MALGSVAGEAPFQSPITRLLGQQEAEGAGKKGVQAFKEGGRC